MCVLVCGGLCSVPVCACAVCLRCAWIYLRYACAVPRASLVLVKPTEACKLPRTTGPNGNKQRRLSRACPLPSSATVARCARTNATPHPCGSRHHHPKPLKTPTGSATTSQSLDRRRSPTIPLHRPCHQAQPRYKQLAQSPGTIYHHYTKTLSQQHPQCPDDNTRPTTRALHEPLL